MAVRTHQEVIPSSRISAISCPFVPIYHSGNSTSSTKKNTLFAKIHVYIYIKKKQFLLPIPKRDTNLHILSESIKILLFISDFYITCFFLSAKPKG